MRNFSGWKTTRHPILQQPLSNEVREAIPDSVLMGAPDSVSELVTSQTKRGPLRVHGHSTDRENY